ncbi:MAG: hypothetical protein GQ535_17155 [Rhodobacteraceae bacterium]|nr:hypothetical protein [Paracoccaceae bacterium]
MQRSEGKPTFMSVGWLKQLWAGRFSFGDTFFVGMFGPAFVFIPVGVVIAGFLAAVAPGTMGVAIAGMTVLYALYFSATLPAVFKTGLVANDIGGWRWFGILLAVASTLALWWSAYKFIVAL